MTRFTKYLAVLAALTVVSRILGMIFVPLVDATEPRYAEIARIMAETGDWITPWFDNGIPFWGKPPLSFWCQAIGIQWFGTNEFAVRMPSLLATLGILFLTYHLARHLVNRHVAWLAVLVYGTSALGYVLAGAVLTDPFLSLATTLALVSVLETVSRDNPARGWQYGLFIGVAIGLLAKGPIAAIFIFAPTTLWIALAFRDRFWRFPWFSGTALMLAIAMPWYIFAELKTPGFLNYFIVGEHIKRFIDPGWSGDLYGSAHEYARGTIWWFAVLATFPWGIIAAVMVIRRWLKKPTFRLPFSWASPTGLLFMWMLWPLAFFTMSGNILWTYVQPALPPFAILLATALSQLTESRLKIATTAAFILPTACLGLVVALHTNTWKDQLETEKNLVQFLQDKNDAMPSLYYLGKRPFSARFYTRGHVSDITPTQLASMVTHSPSDTFYVAVPSWTIGKTAPGIEEALRPVYRGRHYSLFEVSGSTVTALENALIQSPESVPQS